MTFNNRFALLILCLDALWFLFIACLTVFVLPQAFANPSSADIVAAIVSAVGVAAISTFLMNITLLVVQFYFRRKPTEEEKPK